MPQVEPIPKRFWWLKRLLALAGILLLALVGLRWWWGWTAHRRFEAAIAEYRAAGELVSPHEFDARLDAVEDERNAAVLYEQAMAKLVRTADSGVGYQGFVGNPAMFDTYMADAAELVARNGEVLALVRAARVRPDVAWSMRSQDFSDNRRSATLLSDQRSMARCLWFSAYYYHLADNDAQTVETLTDAISFGDAVQAHPVLLSAMTGWACQALMLSFVEGCGAELEVAALGSKQGNVATRRQVARLIGRLLDEQAMRDAAIDAFYGERALTRTMFEDLENSTVAGFPGSHPSVRARVTDFVSRPLYELDVMRMMAECTAAAQAVAEASWPAASTHLPAEKSSPSLFHTLSRPFTEMGYSTSLLVARYHFRALAQRRMAATALAIRLYVVDHGRRPDELSQLVPDYLPAVPLDPLARAGAAIRYGPDAEGPLLYSVGEDGNDNGGVRVFYTLGGVNQRCSDLLFYLGGKPEDLESADPSPSPQAGEDDEDTDHDGRQPDEDQAGQREP